MIDFPFATVNDNDWHNILTFNGYSVAQLDQLVYSFKTYDNDEIINVSDPLLCTYILPSDINQGEGNMKFLCHNIRSMKANFSNFVAEIFSSNEDLGVLRNTVIELN